MGLFTVTNATLFLALIFLSNSEAYGVDLHWLWDNQCKECHGHSAEFARKFLQVTNGQLQGRHYTEDLHLFMRNHYAFDIETDAIYDMLLAQTQIEPRFKQECGACHGSAASFVRQSVTLQAEDLLSRESGQHIRDFLQQHRQLDTNDINFFIRLLTRVAREVYRP